MKKIKTFVIFMLTLCFAIVIHEGGHFIIAKCENIGVLEFNVGVGTKLLSASHGNTQYNLRAFPLGGYLKMYHGGEQLGMDPKQGLQIQPPLKKVILGLGGPGINVLYGFGVLFLLALIGMPVGLPIVGKVIQGMPAEQVGIIEGDRILSVNGNEVDSYQAYILAVQAQGENPLNVAVNRGGDTLQFTLTPQRLSDGTFAIGIMPSGKTVYIKKSAKAAFDMASHMTAEIFRSFVYLLVGLAMKGLKSFNVIGPIGAAQQAQAAVAVGPRVYLVYTAIFNMCLGFFNLLPLPLLDGGNIFFCAAEILNRGPIGTTGLMIYNAFGILLMAAILITSTVQDIRRMRETRGLARRECEEESPAKS